MSSGRRHIANTAKQILLYEAFGAAIPEFAHTPPILNMEGRKLSKRDGVTSIFEFKQMGFIAEALLHDIAWLVAARLNSGDIYLKEAADDLALSE